MSTEASAALERRRLLADAPIGEVAADPADVLAGVPGEFDDVGLPPALDDDRGSDGVGEFGAAPLERGFGAAVGAYRVGYRVVTHSASVADPHVAKQVSPR
jgi:hypothetical protein